MRYVGGLLVLALVFGCSGGGAAPATGRTGPSLQDVAQGIVENCAVVNLEEFFDYLDMFSELIDPQGSPPEFTVTGVDLLRVAVEWEVDFDRDSQADLAGSFRFVDQQGNPTIPSFDLTALLRGLDGFADLLQTLRDGTRLLIDFSLLRAPAAVDGDLDFTFEGGAPSRVGGGFSVSDDTGCAVELEFANVDATELLGRFPAGTFELTVRSGEGSVAGTITFDGTDTATLDLLLDGTDRFTFQLDLLTGRVTPIR